MIFNLLTDLVDPDNIPDGYAGGIDLNNGGWAIIIILLIIIFVLAFVITYLKLQIKKYKQQSQSNTTELKQTDLSDEEKQTISEFRKLTEQERQIITDTIKTFNKPKKE